MLVCDVSSGLKLVLLRLSSSQERGGWDRKISTAALSCDWMFPLLITVVFGTVSRIESFIAISEVCSWMSRILLSIIIIIIIVVASMRYGAC